MKKGQYFDDQFQRGVSRITNPSAPRNAMATPPEPHHVQLVLVDTLRRQLERTVTVEGGSGCFAVILWGDHTTTQLGTFDDAEDAERHRQAVIIATVQAAQRGDKEDRRAA